MAENSKNDHHILAESVFKKSKTQIYSIYHYVRQREALNIHVTNNFDIIA